MHLVRPYQSKTFTQKNVLHRFRKMWFRSFLKNIPQLCERCFDEAQMRPGSIDLQVHGRNSSHVLHSPESPNFLTRLSNRQLFKNWKKKSTSIIFFVTSFDRGYWNETKKSHTFKFYGLANDATRDSSDADFFCVVGETSKNQNTKWNLLG